jgi:hypothetical protein
MTLARADDEAQLARPSAKWTLGRRYGTPVDLLTVASAALAFRLPAVGFGLPTMLHPDEPANIAVAARMAAAGNWNPHFFSYPSLLFDIEALADRAARLIIGRTITPTGVTSQGIGITRTADPGMVLGLRLITAAFSVGICLLMYGVLRRITGRRWAAVGGGLLAATSPLLVTNGVFVTPDTYSAFFTAATLAAALAVLRRGSRLDYVLAGIAVGFTAGSKYDVVAGLPVVVAYILREGGNALRPRALASLALAAVTAAAAFALTTPAALFDTGSLVAGVRVELGHYSTGHPGEQGGSFGFYLNSLLHDQPALLLGAALAVAGACLGRFRREVVVVAAYVAADFALIASQTVRFDRNLLPLLPALILLTGFAAVWVAELAAARWPGMPRRGGLALAAMTGMGVLIPAVIGSVAVPKLLDEHPRTEAAAWLEAHIPHGSSVIEENYGPWLNRSSYQLTLVSYVVSVPLKPGAKAIIVTDKGSGRFIDHAKAYPNESANYTALLTRYCVAARFVDGPWVEVLMPCG